MAYNTQADRGILRALWRVFSFEVHKNLEKITEMTKEQLIEKINKGNYNKDQLISWISCLPRASAKPSENLIGDVYMHPIFGHPYVLLKKKKDVWICGLITSESKCPEILEECSSRFFRGAFITRTLFTASAIEGSFVSVYENKAQLNRIYKQLTEILCQ